MYTFYFGLYICSISTSNIPIATRSVAKPVGQGATLARPTVVLPTEEVVLYTYSGSSRPPLVVWALSGAGAIMPHHCPTTPCAVLRTLNLVLHAFDEAVPDVECFPPSCSKHIAKFRSHSLVCFFFKYFRVRVYLSCDTSVNTILLLFFLVSELTVEFPPLNVRDTG